ncbi:MFS amine transporter [Penicillium lagena]|uniref:MFS amine transporter n=1 Tax=Penicillium lagena TaxID=94218 RepID=UPI00253FEF52|nr:MFS amine transporter [Penicillium lagena]KAJ5611278.1 MFS amine transporter [Penicillium lagena]
MTSMRPWSWSRFRHEPRIPTRPRFVRLRSSKWFILFVVAFAASTDIFLYGLIVPVAPTALEQRVGLAKEEIQPWTSTLLALYAAALLAFSPISGYVADRFESRRLPMLAGLVAVGAATALLCVGTNIGLWIAGRLFQGAAAAVVWTVGIALMVDTVGKEGLGQAIGYVSLSLTLGTLAGPLLGGVLYEDGGYYAVFGLAFGLIAFDVFLRLVLIEQKDAKKWLEDEKEQQPLESEKVEMPLAEATPNAEVQETAHDTQAVTLKKRPFGRLAVLLSSSRLIVSLWGYFILSLVLSSLDSVLPIFVQETFGWQQAGQGLIFIPCMVPHTLDPLIGYIIDRYPKTPRYLTSAGFFCCLPLMVLLRLVKENTMHDKILLCALLALIGCCIALTMTPLVAEVFHAVKEKEEISPDIFGRGGAMALAFGLSNMGFAAGSLLGPFFAGFIRKEAGWGTMGWALGLLVGVSGVPTLLIMGGWIMRKPKPQVESPSAPE